MDRLKLVLATTNSHKVKEFKDALGAFPLDIEPIPGTFSCPETESTFLGNAGLKALEGARLTGMPCLADDSGLCVEALGGEPGLYSARYWEGGQGLVNILSRLAGHENRKAHFVCALVLAIPHPSSSGGAARVIWETQCLWHGQIALEPQGDLGFGYDPIFLPQGCQGLSAAQIPLAQKNRESHRAQAVAELGCYLKNTQFSIF